MHYHNISKDNLINGDGLRVVLWVSGCSHHCDGCHNKITWDCNSGLEFDSKAENEIYEQLDKDYISGVTFSGGDPLYSNNLTEIYKLCIKIKARYPSKTIWIYTGYTFEELINPDVTNMYCNRQILINRILKYIDVLVDGKFVKELADVQYKWAGSTNQRVIDVKESIGKNKVVLWK